ncbi:hypothetical protein V1514DRAFT_284622, partial [Lipomyces japonicus]|uniref:uncharacterized protein n=1 Tax=Lipomyces japonicus TaxID=56871 RepID=UPI0034CF03A1
VLKLAFAPSDPDFPFDLEQLQAWITVPVTYPSEPPIVSVKNADIPRGYALNIEHGFVNQILPELLNVGTLLDMIHELDRRLEEFLKAEKRPTIKFVKHSQKPGVDSKSSNSALDDWGVNLSALTISSSPDSITEQYSNEDLSVAASRRAQELRQVQVRIPGTQIITDNSRFSTVTVPFKFPSGIDLPSEFETITTCQFHVPSLYNLEPYQLVLAVDDPVGTIIELNFNRHVDLNREFSLFAGINYLTQNLEALLIAPEKESSNVTVAHGWDRILEPENDDEYTEPPEWADEYEHDEEFKFYDNENEQGSRCLEEDSDDEPESNVDDASDDARKNLNNESQVPSRAISVSLPGIQLVNISILECTALSLVVRCVRCKTEAEFRNLTTVAQVSEPCTKCHLLMTGLIVKTEFIHQSSTIPRIGYVDLEACAAVDLLPSAFMPTCESCSENLPGTTGISGIAIAQTISTNCRTCHSKMSIYIPQVKFSRVSDEPMAVDKLKTIKIRTDDVWKGKVIAGSRLPADGTCKHYKRSTRWFRFSCCNRVFPCDHCHDEQSAHANEHANRMICGMCSREQNYAPEICAYCRHSFFRKTTGFWEGGKGTRDQVKMSRKDPRKYKQRFIRNV